VAIYLWAFSLFKKFNLLGIRRWHLSAVVTWWSLVAGGFVATYLWAFSLFKEFNLLSDHCFTSFPCAWMRLHLREHCL
jgi:hypothetical protein